MAVDRAELWLSVAQADRPDGDSPQPALHARTTVRNTGSQNITVTANEFQFHLLTEDGEEIGELPIGDVTVEDDSRYDTIAPGEETLVETSLKFLPEVAEPGKPFQLRVHGYGTEATTTFRFEK